MKTLFIIQLIFEFGLATAVADVSIEKVELPRANVYIRVIDENGNLVNGAKVSLYFNDKTANAKTDLNGIVKAEGSCNISGIGSKITKDGYYLGSAPIPKFTQVNHALNEWQPWGDTYNVVLRPLVNPIPLYAKKVSTIIPVLDKPCGYDLEVGDWVKPYGIGIMADFVFDVRKTVKNVRNFDAHGYLNFSNPLDGMQSASPPDIATNSIYKWQRRAPENGYESSFSLQNTWFSDSKSKPIKSFRPKTEWEGYFFRVRSISQEGKIVSAHYGKIRGGIEIDPRYSSTCSLKFTYYYNPTPLDQNLEWDINHNLFDQLDKESIPMEP